MSRAPLLVAASAPARGAGRVPEGVGRAGRARRMSRAPLLLAAALLAAAPALAADAPRMREEAAEAGISHVYDGPWEHFVGGGVAVFDCDGDRRPDLLFAGGANPAQLYANRSPTAGPLRFEPRPLPLSGREATGATGAYPLDIDDDGFLDVALLRVGRSLILKGGPDCAFTVADRGLGVEVEGWTTAFAAAWEEGATRPTLAFGRYVDRAAPGAPWGTCAENLLVRPEPGPGPLRFAEPVPFDGACALSMLFTDWANDGRLSLRVSNDRQYHIDRSDQLFRIEPGRPPRAFAAADGWRRLTIWGMGIAEADLDADGFPEYALTSMGDTRLQRLDRAEGEDRPAYADIALERGATAHRPYAGGDIRPSTGWHAAFADVNNDARLDLYIAKGNVESMPDFAAFDPDNLLIGGHDGRFVERGAEAGIALDRRGRGAGLADFNSDGLLDLVVVNRGGPVSLFRNLGAPKAVGAGEGPMGNWIAVELRQPAPNRHAVGARLSVRIGNEVIERRVQVGGGHASGALGWVHLGLATAPRAEVRVRWPDGEWSHAFRVPANQFAVIERGRDAPRFWLPP
jgi:hypothetical protein